MEIILWIVGAWVLLQVATRALAWSNLTRLSLQATEQGAATPEDVPDYILTALRRGAQELVGEGFIEVGCNRVTRRMVADPGPPSWSLLLRHPDDRVCAEVSQWPLPEPGEETAITLSSTLSDGHVIATYHGTAHAILGTLPETTVVASFAPELDGLLSEHRARVAEVLGGREVVAPEPETLLASQDRRIAGMLDDMVQRGELVPTDDDRGFRVPTFGALPLYRRAKRYRVEYARFTRARAHLRSGPPPPIDDVHLDLQADAFLSRPGRPMRRRTGREKAVMLIVTMALAAASFAVFFPLADLLILMGVLVIHELGHLAAMRALGYADTSIFFLPFFGAAAAGRKDDATPSQRLVVAFMGPLPGLLVGLLMFHHFRQSYDVSDLYVRTMLMISVVNWANLVPLLPLDGGHILNHLVFARHPHLETLFRAVAVVGFAYGAVRLEPLLWILVFFGVVGFSTQVRVSRMKHAVQASLDGRDERARARRYFQWLAGSGYAHLTFMSKVGHIRRAELRGGLQSPGLLGTVFFGALWLVAFIWPLSWVLGWS